VHAVRRNESRFLDSGKGLRSRKDCYFHQFLSRHPCTNLDVENGTFSKVRSAVVPLFPFSYCRHMLFISWY
jgi:hypothetical protein